MADVLKKRKRVLRLGAVTGPLAALCSLVAIGASALWVMPLAASTPGTRPGWTPSALTVLAELRSAALDDLDGDGVLDLVLTAAEVQVCFRNDGHGNFTPTPCPPIEPTADGHCAAFAVGDIDQDRLPDIVIGTGGCESVAVLISGSKGGFALADVYPLGARLTRLQLQDLDGDGRLDVVASSGATDPPLVLANRGPGQLARISTGATSQSQ